MLKDGNSLAVTTDNPKEIAAINLFADQLPRLGKDVEQIVKDATPFSYPLIQAYTAAVFLYAQTEEASNTAKEYLDRIREVKMNDREKSLVHALDLWQQTKMSAALAHFEKHCNK